MRRFKQQLSHKEILEILEKATNGVLSLIDFNGLPYGVPLSFVFDGKDSIFFHCAKEGRKIDCIKNSSHACFTIIDRDEIRPFEFTTYFRSVIVEGEILPLDVQQEIVDALRLLSTKYSPGIDCELEIEKGIGRVLVLKFEIKSFSGKEAIELTRQRTPN